MALIAAYAAIRREAGASLRGADAQFDRAGAIKLETLKCPGLTIRRTNARNVGFLAEHVSIAPNGGTWRTVIATAAPDPERKSHIPRNRSFMDDVNKFMIARGLLSHCLADPIVLRR